MPEAVTAPSGQQKSCKSCGAAFASELSVCPQCQAPYAPEAPSSPTVTEGQPVDAAPPAATNGKAPTDLEAGETLLGQWKLESKIGEGGMGNVFLATELKLGRKVAVKALGVGNLQDETVKRFEREAQVMGKLDHPNIVTLYAVGRHRDVPFLVMRYLEGGSLWDLLDANGGRLTPEQLLPLVKQLCSALGYIHGKNLIHRDLKPSNIFISPQGKVTLLDLGLARGHTTALTRTGIIWGTPDFMAPEQIVGEKQLDGRADLYALGVVLYRMISNQPPFPDADEQDLMRAHLTRPRPDISKVWFQASAGLSLFLQKAMAIKPEDRFQTAEELSAAFERVVNTKEPATRASASVPAVTTPPPAAAAPTAAAKGPVPTAAPAPRASVPTQPAPIVPAAAAAEPAPPPAPAPAPVPAPAPAPAPAAAVKGPVTTSVPVQHGGKGKIIDELDDDATELGELPPELMGLINADGASTIQVPANEPEPPKPIPRKSVSGPPKVAAAGPVPETPKSARGSGVTAYDRPPASRPAPPGVDEPSKNPSATVTDEPETGPQQTVVGTIDLPPSGPMMVRTGDIEPDDDDADMKTVVGTSVNIPEEEPGGATTVMPPPSEQTKAMPPPQAPGPATAAAPAPAPRVSAPRSTGSHRAVQPRKTSSGTPAPRKETTSVSGKKRVEEPPAEETPPWMHPYVLVTGGLLLLALGFLIGVLLR